MSSRSWFFAANNQQQGPYSDEQLRQFVSSGAVVADTFVWTEGMADWQRAADIPGLLPRGSGQPALQGSGAPALGGAGGTLSADLGVWGLLGRSLLYGIGTLFVIPAPWVAVMFYRWFVPRVNVPGRPNLEFTGKPTDIWWAFMLLAVSAYANATSIPFIGLLAIALQAFLGWFVLRWAIVNISSGGRQLPLTFNGSALYYIGWQVLLVLSALTIIGWAWVVTAWIRWIFRNIAGSRREIVFNASGLEMLWRTLVFALGCAFIIPIPWLLRWYANWTISQIALVQRV
jgi:hypothetical protein